MAITTPKTVSDCDPAAENLDLTSCLMLNETKQLNDVDAYKTPGGLVNLVVRNVFMLAGMILFAMIVLAGFKMAMSPSSKEKGDAKKIIEGVGVGFLIMFSAYWIIQIIEVLIGDKILF